MTDVSYTAAHAPSHMLCSLAKCCCVQQPLVDLFTGPVLLCAVAILHEPLWPDSLPLAPGTQAVLPSHIRLRVTLYFAPSPDVLTPCFLVYTQ